MFETFLLNLASTNTCISQNNGVMGSYTVGLRAETHAVGSAPGLTLDTISEFKWEVLEQYYTIRIYQPATTTCVEQ